MNIFGGRPGIAAGVLAVVASLAAFFLYVPINIVILVAVTAFIAVCILLCVKKKITGYRLFANTVVLAVFSMVLLRGIYVYHNRAPLASALCGKDSYVLATVRECRTSGDYYSTFIVDIHSVNGVKCNEKAELSCEYNSDLQKGYEIVLRHAEIIYFDDLDAQKANELLADEIFLSVVSVEPDDYAILSEDNLSLFNHFEDFNKYLSAKLRNEIKGDEGRLAAAMLLGDKGALKSEMYRDFSRAGLSHYLAISGLHVSIITGIVGFFLVKIGMRRSRRNLLLAVFAVSYLFLLGFPTSAVRAVIMLMAVFVAYSAGDISDSINSLGIAAALILTVNPTAVFEKSFILSFSATLGIVSFMPLFNELMTPFLYPKRDGEEKKTNKLWFFAKKGVSFVVGTLFSVACALSLTLLPTAYLFGEMSRFGFRSNLIATFAATSMMLSLLLYLLLGGIPYVRDVLLLVIRKSAGFMLSLASDIGDEVGALVSLVSKTSLIIISVFTAIILIILIIKIKNKKLLLLAPAVYPIVLALLIVVGRWSLPHRTEISALNMSESEYVLAVHEDESVLIDVSLGSLNGLRLLSSDMHDRGITEIDTLVLTHYHTRHISVISRFTAEEKVRRVVLPYPENEADAWIMLQLADNLAASGISCEIAPDDGFTVFDEMSICISRPHRLDRSNHPVISFSLSEGEKTLTYVSESAWETEGEVFDSIISTVSNSDVLLFGSHGPVAKTPFESLGDHLNADEVVIFDESLIEYVVGRYYFNDPFYESIAVYTGGAVFTTSFPMP